MTNNILLPAVLAAPAMRQASSGVADRSSQGWLRELERAQAGLFEQPDAARDKHEGHHAEAAGGSFEPESARPLHGLLLQDVFREWVAPQALPAQPEVVGTGSPQQVLTALQATPALSVSGIAFGIFQHAVNVFEAEDTHIPEVGSALPGRDEREVSRNSFKLVRSGEGMVDAAVRAPEMTLESELRLGQQIRAAVQTIGSRLGKVWLNGHAVMNNFQGERNGD